MCENDKTDVPQHILLKSAEAKATLIPKKSAERYHKEFNLFVDWRTKNEVSNTTEDVVLAYLLDLVSLVYYILTHFFFYIYILVQKN